MKQSVVIAFLLLSAHCSGQEWHLNTFSASEEYPYQYRFQFDNISDTCSHQLQTKSGFKASTVSIFDKNGTPIIATHIKIECLETDSVISFTTNLDGKVDCLLEKGNYKIHVLTSNYDRFELEFKIGTKQFIELAIYLGLAPELIVYQVNSKRKLEESEIRKIMDCVKKERQGFSELCSDKDDCNVVMQL